LHEKQKHIFKSCIVIFRRSLVKFQERQTPKKTVKFCKNAFVRERKNWDTSISKFCISDLAGKKNEKTMERRKKKKRKNFWVKLFSLPFF